MERLFVPVVALLFMLIFMGFYRSEGIASGNMKYFSDNYQEAREKFLEAAREIDADIYSFQNPHTGPKGEALYMDVAIIGSKNATDYLVLGSGTHGVEGFAGSGIQTGLLRQGIHNELGSHIGLIMIHAINPYGFAHLRRSNEDNIDLNRNFINHTKPYPENEGYEKLADVILPKSLSTWADIKLRISLFWYRLSHGRDAMKRAVSGDQFSHPTGLFFGGHHEAWSNKTLTELLRVFYPNTDDWNQSIWNHGKETVDQTLTYYQ
jgi:hypothetical protein